MSILLFDSAWFTACDRVRFLYRDLFKAVGEKAADAYLLTMFS
jgi:hypothetical protein